MKTLHIISLFILTLSVLNISAQRIGDLKGIHYQAVAIDENGKEIVGMDVEGKPLYHKTIGVRFSIHKGVDGQLLYQENHEVQTDRYGLFSVVIGMGTQSPQGSYNSLMEIPWIDADQFLKVEITTRNDGNYRMVSNQQFMSVPYSYYTNDIADDAITTEKILDYTILNQDVSTGAIDTRTILDETILNEDIATGAIDTRTILNETILNEDIATGAIDTRTILNETILNEDIATGAIDTRTILNETILNEDIANNTIDLTSKVTNILEVEHGGTGVSVLEDGGLMIGGGNGPVKVLSQATDGQVPVGVTNSDPVLKTITGGTGIEVDITETNVVIRSTISSDVSADGIETINIGNIAAGTTYVSPSFPVPGGNAVMGDIILASIDKNLQGCILTPYLFSDNTARIAIFNGTGGGVNLGNNVAVKILIVK